jgi:(p)ppGpp synthase/HD superfamily hydrolase
MNENDIIKPYVSEVEFVKTLKQKGLYTAAVKAAILQSKKSHKNQVRDDGNPYLNQHVFPVALSSLAHFENSKDINVEDLIVTALLHDAYEDDPTFTCEDCTRVFGKNIETYLCTLNTECINKDIVETITDKLRKSELDVQMASKYPITQIVRLEDKLNNAKCSSLNTSPEMLAKYKTLVTRIERYYLPMAKSVSLQIYDELDAAARDLDMRVTNFSLTDK